MGSGGTPGRLRGELTEFVGRRSELALVRQALGAARLVTLTGPGGIGKTRLALQAADGARRLFPGGVWLAELGGLRDPALLVPEVARSLGLSDQSGRWAVATLSDYLPARQVLLVLDQCEHLVRDGGAGECGRCRRKQAGSVQRRDPAGPHPRPAHRTSRSPPPRTHGHRAEATRKSR